MQKIETQIVPIRLTPTEIDELDRIRAAGKFDSRSAVLRDALYQLSVAHGVKPQTGIQIEEERKACRPRRATIKPRDIPKELRQPTYAEKKIRVTKGIAKRRKPRVSKVK